jgi:hypothetical protein
VLRENSQGSAFERPMAKRGRYSPTADNNVIRIMTWEVPKSNAPDRRNSMDKDMKQ